MRLTKIKLAGFKSFVDPTTIPIIGNLAAVVGPNGCGKSNVIDAVRWVMGESSAKKLRGGELADVIFNGSTARKPLGQASVELQFDNSDGALGGEYAHYTDISIRRLVTREGQSHYFLNGIRCRRKDITDVFLGTGLGPRSYAIIEQGTISKVIEAKPEDLRTFIEEAAGISKYKERRRETETRIKHTRENLERLTDLRDELEKQLKHLHRQSQSAEKYKTLKTDERLYEAQLAALSWNTLDEQIQHLDVAIREATNNVEKTLSERQSLETELEKNRQILHDATDSMNEVQENYYALGNEITRLEQVLQHHEERKQTLEDDFHQANHELTQARAHLTQDETRIQSLQNRLDTITPEHEQYQAQAEDVLLTLQEKEEALEHWRQEVEACQRALEQATRQADIEKTKITHHENQIHQAKTREQKLMEELTRLDEAQSNDSLEAMESGIEQAIACVQDLDQQLTELQAKKRETSEQLQSAKQQLKDSEKEHQKEEARLSSLEALQQAVQEGEGQSSKAWMERQGIAHHKRLYQTIDIEPQWSHALETVLGDGLEAIVAHEHELAHLARDAQDFEGILHVVTPSQRSEPFRLDLPQLIQKLSTVTPEIMGLLAGVYCVDTIEDALRYVQQLQPHESIITQEGLWLGPNWMRLRKQSKDPRAGVLEREQAIKSLRVFIHESEQRLESQRDVLKEMESSLNDIDEQREELQFARNQAFKQMTEQKATLSTLKERIRHTSSRVEQIQQDLEDIRASRETWQGDIDAARKVVAEAVEQMSEQSQRRESLEVNKQSVVDEVREIKEQSNQAKNKEHQLALEMGQLNTELQATQHNIERSTSQIQHLEDRLHQLQQQKESNLDPVEDLRMTLEETLEQRLEVETRLQTARDLVSDIEQKVRAADKTRHELESQVQKQREHLEQSKMSWQGLSVRRETVLEKLKDSEYQLKDLLETMPEEANEKDWQHQLSQIQNQIQRLGAINLAAIEEYASQSERKAYLDAQDKDLQDALSTLENAIAKIDKESRHRFKETFDKIDANFRILFPKLFGGGQAYLTMTGEDLLDTGISVIARPPGKKNTTIHLLSGGEKALTAVSLVFSIFQLNPAPFCMLDEVDAPLDDYNVSRFCNLVKEMAKTVQFVYISHNKLALEMADQLQGVTMKEPGVSRIVTVDVEEARTLAQA